MSSIALLMGLLVLSYLGSLLVGSGRTRGLASGIEFVGLGFAVGPKALALVDQSMITNFEPIVQVALGWLAFVVGLDFGRAEGRRVRRGSALLGITCATITGVVVGLVVWRALQTVVIPGMDEKSALLLAAGAGAVCAETTRWGVSWARQRWNAKGPLSNLLVDIGAADDLVPLVATGAIFSFFPPPHVGLELPPVGWFAAFAAIGGLLGLVTALLLRSAEGDAVWGALIGVLFLMVGVAGRFGGCTIFVTFVMGIALAAASPSRRALRKLVTPTERMVLYPMLLLAGARLNPTFLVDTRYLGVVFAFVLVARIVGKLVSGVVVRASTPAARPAGPLLGLVLLSSGPVSISCGFVFALRFPGVVGDTLLLCAVGSIVLGELVSTFGLRALLLEAGEITQAAAPAPPRAGSTPPPAMNVPQTRTSAPPPPLVPESRYDLADLAGDDD